MNCPQALRLLPLWIGRDLPDASEAEALRMHLAHCQACSLQQRQLQASLDALQSISTTSLAGESGEPRPSLWPRLAMVLKDAPRHRDRFNGWIPATAMALAAALMVAVSVVQVRREMGNAIHAAWNQRLPTSANRNLFQTDGQFAPTARNNRDVPVRGLVVNPAPEF